MRPLATWIVVGSLAVLGLFAVRDAFRGQVVGGLRRAQSGSRNGCMRRLAGRRLLRSRTT